MKSRRTQLIFTLATIILVVGFVLVPGAARADISSGLSNVTNHSTTSSFGAGSLVGNFLMGYFGSTDSAVGAASSLVVKPIVDAVLEVLANWGLRISNLILSLSGVVLNAVMIITLNMATLMGGSNNIIDATWSTIRDLASIIIIFFLLYESIKIIIGVSDSKVKHIIVMVAIAGILLNFSLFFAKMGVDASNLVGLAFYRAIAPSGANLDMSSTTVSSSNFIANTLSSGGIADEFMQALHIQTADVYQTGDGTNPLTIIQSALYGIVLQLIAAFVFLAAAFLFLIRVGLLVVLLVFSPFYFIGMVVPKVEEKISKPWLDMIIDQCLILPIFMFFMYIAMRVITNPGFQSIINPAGGSATLGGSAAATIGMFIQYFIAIILICISLIAALKYASVGKDLVNTGIKRAKGWAARGVQKSAQQTFGRGANFIQNKAAQSDWAKNNPNAALMFNKAAGVVSTASFGDKKSKDGFVGAEKKRKEGQDKSRKDLYERMNNVNREDYAFGEKGQEEYEKEKKAAFERQETLVENMKTETIMSRMMGDNPNARSQYKLEKDYNADYGKEYSGEIKAEMERNREELTKIAELLNPENTLKMLGQDRSVETLKSDKTRLESRNKDLGKFQDAAARQKEANAIKELAKSVNELNKKDKPEDGGDSKKEKPKKESGDDETKE